MSRFLVVALGGAIGAVSRYSVALLVALFWKRDFPLATFLINVSGSFILGVAAGIIRDRLPPEYGTWYLLIGTGFCGGYTTFSTFEYETLQLVRDGSWAMALAYVLGSVLVGFVGVYAGLLLCRLLPPQ